MTAFLVAVGLKERLQSGERLALAVERDALAMRRRGYRIASTHDYTMPLFGVTYRKVTYELMESRGWPR